ncbi:MAG TPA: TIM barrel protein [Pirellulales bacterium]|nr:TIM barrel protein [Pirellulales bacterium]
MFKNLNPEALGISAGPSELIELALSSGFRSVDLNLAEFALQVKEYGLPKARRLLDSAKLKIGSFTLPLDCGADDTAFTRQLDQLPSLVAPAVEVGAMRAVTVIEPACDERPYHQNFELHRQRLADIGKKLAPLGVRLGVGFQALAEFRAGKHFEFVHSLDALLVLLSTVGSRQVGVSLDLWQVWAGGGSLDVARAKLKPDQIVTVQLADAAEAIATPERASLSSRRLPGETGVIDGAAALVALAEWGYQGPITPAPDASRFAGMRRDAVVKLAAETLDAVWKAAGLSPAGKITAPAGK